MKCVVKQMDIGADFCSAVKQIICIETAHVKSLDKELIVNETNIM